MLYNCGSVWWYSGSDWWFNSGVTLKFYTIGFSVLVVYMEVRLVGPVWVLDW